MLLRNMGVIWQDTRWTHTHIHINPPRLFGCSLVSTVTEDKKKEALATAGC